MNPAGTHLIAELSGCPAELLNDAGRLEAILTEGIRASGLHHLNVVSHQFDPFGVTIVAIISESHVALHTYPENGHVSLDIFHCSQESAPAEALRQYLASALGAQKAETMLIQRGEKLQQIP